MTSCLGLAETDLWLAGIYLRHGKRTLALLRMRRAVRVLAAHARGEAC